MNKPPKRGFSVERPTKATTKRKIQHYIDIRTYPFEGGEIIITFDNELPGVEYTLRVQHVEETDVEGIVLLKCLVISAGHPLHKAATTVDIRLNRFDGMPFLGFVATDVYGQDADGNFGSSLVDQLRYFLIAYLRNKDLDNYSAPIRDIVLHFASIGVFPEDGDYYDPDKPKGERIGPGLAPAIKAIRKAIRMNEDGLLTYDAGHKLVCYHPNMAKRILEGTFQTDNSSLQVVRAVDKDKFMRGMMLIIESGVLTGPIRWV